MKQGRLQSGSSKSAVRVCRLHRQAVQRRCGPGDTAKSTREIVNDSAISRGQTPRSAAARRSDGEGHPKIGAQEYERAAAVCVTTSALCGGPSKRGGGAATTPIADAVAFAQDELEAYGIAFTFAGGRVRAARYVVDKLDGEDLQEAGRGFRLAAYLVDGYESPAARVLVRREPEDADVVAELMTIQRGSRVEQMRVPHAATSATLLENSRTQREHASSLSTSCARAQRPVGLTGAFGACRIRSVMADAAVSIEAIDISNMQKRRGGENGRLEDTASHASLNTAVSPFWIRRPCRPETPEGVVTGAIVDGARGDPAVRSPLPARRKPRVSPERGESVLRRPVGGHGGGAP